jgi:hypothetical protein
MSVGTVHPQAWTRFPATILLLVLTLAAPVFATTTSTTKATTTVTTSSTTTSTLLPPPLVCALVLGEGVSIIATSLLRCRVRAALRPAFDEPGCVVNRARNPYLCYVSEPDSTLSAICGKRGKPQSPVGCPECVTANRELIVRSVGALLDRLSPQMFCGVDAAEQKARRKGRKCSRTLVKGLRRMVAETVRCRSTEASTLYDDRLNATAPLPDVKACESAALADATGGVPDGCCFDASTVAKDFFDGIDAALDGAFCQCPSGTAGLCRSNNPCTRGYCDGEGCRTANADGASCAEDDRDDNDCTDDACQGGACGHKARPNNVLCRDDDKCQMCVDGVCVAMVSEFACLDDNPCTADACIAASGCAHTNVLDGTPCPSDGNPSTVDGCRNGVCVHLPAS